MLSAQLLRLWRAEQLYILPGDVQTKPVIFFHAGPSGCGEKVLHFSNFFPGAASTRLQKLGSSL
jgi:hypothetical protein